MKKKDLIFVLETLGDMYPDAKTELNYSTPFQLLMAVILSAQATDKQVNKVSDKLFLKVRGPKDILDMGYDNREYSIRSIGLYKSKAKNIWKTSNLLASDEYNKNMSKCLDNKMVKKVYDDFGYIIPDELDDLMTLYGVGEKTAKVVVHVLYKKPVIAVDTHVHRVTNRLGIVKTKQALQTSKELEKIVPDSYKDIAHHSIILFGRYHCTARKPKCEACPLSRICRYYKRGKTKRGNDEETNI